MKNTERIYQEIKRQLENKAPKLTQDQKSRMYRILNSSNPNNTNYRTISVINMEEVNRKFKKYNKVFTLYNLNWAVIIYIILFSMALEGYVSDSTVMLLIPFLISFIVYMMSLGFILDSFYQLMKRNYNLSIDEVKDLWAKTKTMTYNLINLFLNCVVPPIIAYSFSFNLILIFIMLVLNIIIFAFFTKKILQTTFPNPYESSDKPTPFEGNLPK